MEKDAWKGHWNGNAAPLVADARGVKIWVDKDACASAAVRQAAFAAEVKAECDAIREMLVAKNLAYGDSALDPLRVFASADPIEQLNVRIDDKLSRLKRGHAAGEDTDLDLIGYLVLRRIAIKRRAADGA